MNKPVKLLLGILTIWPLIYAIFFFINFAQSFYLMVVHGSGETILYRWFDFHTLLLIHLIIMVWNFILIVFYIIHAVRNGALKNEMKALWAAIIFMGSVLVMPVYWYLNIWREREKLS